MSEEALKLVLLRNNFYRDNYRRVVIALLLMILVNIALAGVLIYQITHPAPPQYFATTTEGKIIPLSPLSEPMADNAEILQWATDAARSLYNYSFVNWRGQLQIASDNFTPEAWDAYQQQLKDSRNLETVIAEKSVVSAEPTGAPVILNQGVINGRYSWKLKLPMLINYQGTRTHQQPVEMVMLISRVPILNTPRGYAIAQLYITQRAVEGNE